MSATRISSRNCGGEAHVCGLRCGYRRVAKSRWALLDLRDGSVSCVDHLRGQRREMQRPAELLPGADRVGEEVPQRLRLVRALRDAGGFVSEIALSDGIDFTACAAAVIDAGPGTGNWPASFRISA